MPPRPRLIPALLTAAVSIFAVFVTLKLLQLVPLPLPARSLIRSSTIVLGQSPYKVHIAFAIGLLVTIGVTLASLWGNRLQRAGPRLSVLLFSAVVAIWALNSVLSNQGLVVGMGGDPFHEGEYLGFRQSYLQGGLDNCMVIHGPMLNILPSLIAGPYRDDGYSIAIARLCRSFFGLLALVGYLWGLWELTRWYTDEQRGAVFRLLLVGVIALDGILFLNYRRLSPGPFRDAGFYLPLALLLRWLGAANARPRRDLVYGVLLGLLTVAGPLVSYERGVSWPVVLALGIAIGAVIRGRSLPALAAGLLIGGGIAAILFKHELRVALSQSRYWAKFGDIMFALPVELRELRWNTFLLSQLLILFGALSWVVRDFCCREMRFRDWLREQAPLLILLLVAVLTTRRVLARGDLPHYQLAGMPEVLVLASVLLLNFRRYGGREGIRWPGAVVSQLNKPAALLAAAVLLVLVRPSCSPLSALHYVADWKPNHAKVSDQTQDILAAIYRHGPLGPRDLYPLDSAGLWFYLTSSASPSRFHQLIYAMPEASQRQLVDDLEQHHTRVILAQPEGWLFDGVAQKVMFPIVQQYLDGHYTSAEMIHGYRVLVRSK